MVMLVTLSITDHKVAFLKIIWIKITNIVIGCT